MPETEVKKIKRSEFATFLNITPKAGATYARMGKGITSQSISYSPTVTTETYIHEDSATNSLDGYAASLNTPQTCYAGEPIFEFIDGLRRKRAVGADAETDIVMVYIYAAGTEAGSYAAERNKCTIAVEEFGGEGGQATSLTYTIHLNGNPELGTAKITNGHLSFMAG